MKTQKRIQKTKTVQKAKAIFETKKAAGIPAAFLLENL
jgi:hypothetical protein